MWSLESQVTHDYCKPLELRCQRIIAPSVGRRAIGDIGWMKLEETVQVALCCLWKHEFLELPMHLHRRPGEKRVQNINYAS